MGRIGRVTAASVAAGMLLLGLPAAALASASGAEASGAATSSAATATRLVSYRGYQVRVPASWPVYRLAADPGRCVLFNQHAVYLGSPGADQRCPVRALGRTEALLVQPLGPPGDLPPGTVVQRDDSAVPPTGAVAAGAADHEVQLALPAAGVLVTATYGSGQALIGGILGGARVTSAGSAGAARAARAARSAGAGSAGAGGAAGSAGSTELTGVRGSGLGFDACTAPSVTTMTDWLSSPYRVAGTYLGGDNWACSYGNFNRSWVSQVAAEGWRFIPIWVGPQAPCSTIPKAILIKPAQAGAEGKAQATRAVATAAGFGYGQGTPIYFDMEGYDTSTAGCSAAVLKFLNGWTLGLHAAGYLSGVYSSADSGIAALVSKYGKPGYHEPDDIWPADWNGDPVPGDPAVPAGDWAHHQRLHQYYGGHNETWGGATVNVDNDVADGALAGLASAPTPPASHLTDAPDAVAVAPGGHATVRLLLSHTGAGRARVNWQVQPPSGLTVSPGHGSVRVAAGHPATVTLQVAAGTSAAQGRYDLPVTATSGKAHLAETFELVSVVPSGGSLSTTEPIVLYAADTASMKTAFGIAQRLALPTADLTGTFSTAWTDLTGGQDIVLAVGQAAANALFYNECGWTNPQGLAGGSTPFSYVGEPLQQPPGADFFADSAGGGNAATASVTEGLTHYAVAGSLPNQGVLPASVSAPTKACLGSPTVPVP